MSDYARGQPIEIIMLAWQELRSRIADAEKVLLISHVRPDGDALGSELAMADLLTRLGKEVEIFNPSPTPERYLFIPHCDRVGSQHMGQGLPQSNPDLIMVLDTGTWNQLAGLADYVRASQATRVVIDHHRTQDDLSALQLVDVEAPACGVLIYRAYREWDMTPTPASAVALFVAIAMDTGWMHHSNTTPEVFQIMGELLGLGVRPETIYRNLFESSSLARLKLLSFMLSRVMLVPNTQVVTSYVLQEDIRAAGAHPMETEDFVGMLLSVRGADGALFIIEQAGGGVKVSFRATGTLDCSQLAAQFGGGGHRAAAGAMVSLPLEEARAALYQAVQQALAP